MKRLTDNTYCMLLWPLMADFALEGESEVLATGPLSLRVKIAHGMTLPDSARP